MKQELLELMQNAADNCYPMWDWEPIQVAWDIQAYVDEFADINEEDMAIVIKEIQMEHKLYQKGHF